MVSEYISQISLFKTLTESERSEIDKISFIKSYGKNTHLFYYGHDMTHFYFVIDGQVKIYRSDEDGKEQIVNIFGKGDMFPHHALFRSDPYPASAITAKDSRVLMISKKDFELLLHSNTDIAIKMFRYMGNLLVDLQIRLQEKHLKTSDEQLLLLLRRLYIQHGEIDADDSDIAVIKVRLTKQEMANMVGLTRETVSRNLSIFKKKGIIIEGAEGYIHVKKSELDKHV